MAVPAMTDSSYLGEVAGHLDVHINANDELQCSCGAVGETEHELAQSQCDIDDD